MLPCLRPEPGSHTGGQQVSWKVWSLAASQVKIGFFSPSAIVVWEFVPEDETLAVCPVPDLSYSVTLKQRVALVSGLQSRRGSREALLCLL